MYNHILLPTDGSDVATEGLLHGLDLAQSLDASVTIVTVTEMWSAVSLVWHGKGDEAAFVRDYDARARASAQAVLTEAAKAADARSLVVETIHVPDSNPADGIIATAATRNCDLIVMASHGRRGVQRLVLGSQTHKTVMQTRVPVLVVMAGRDLAA